MENILFIHGHEYDKINLFSKMADEYNKREVDVKILAFSRFEKNIYSKNNLHKEIVFMPKELKKYKLDNLQEYNKYLDEELENMIKYNYIYNISNGYEVDKEYYKYLCKLYLEFLKQFVEKHNISKFVMWNNSYIFDRISWYFAKKNDIKMIVMEQGFFRPFTITVDSKGVNYENSMPRYREYYENIQVDSRRVSEYLTKPETYDLKSFSTLSKAKVFTNYNRRYLYSILDKVNFKSNLELDCRIINYNLFDLIKKYKRNMSKHNEDINLPDKYIFVPFQVEDDSQIILHSPNIDSMKELIDVINRLSIKFEEYYFVFKEHPVSNVSYESIYAKYKDNKKLIFLKGGSTEYLISNSEAVVTVNSTVGIEALIKGKKVMTLGNAFFNINGLVQHCCDVNNINKEFENLINSEFNKELVEKFLYDLRFNYQKEIFWKNPSKIQIKSLINDIM